MIPFFLLIAASFTDNSWAVSNGFSFFPGKLSLEAYEYIAVQWGVIGKAYLMTLVVTGAGTVLSLGISTLFAYSISHKEIPGMKVLNFLLIFTMFFNGGLVSTYYSYVNLYHMKNTIFALIIPNLLMNAFNVILIKNYFLNSIPESLLEAAKSKTARETARGSDPFAVQCQNILKNTEGIFPVLQAFPVFKRGHPCLLFENCLKISL